jgi:hypothetical protein
MKTNAAIVQEFKKQFPQMCSDTHASVPRELFEKIESFLLTHLNAKDALIEKARQEGHEMLDEIEIIRENAEAVCILASGTSQRNIMSNILKPLDDLLARASEIPPNENTNLTPEIMEQVDKQIGGAVKALGNENIGG